MRQQQHQRGREGDDADTVAAAPDALPRAAHRPHLLLADLPVHQRHAPRHARRRRQRARARRVLLRAHREHLLRSRRARDIPLGAPLWCVPAVAAVLCVWIARD